MAEKELRIKIVFDDGSINEKLDQLLESQQKNERQSEKTSSAFSRFGATIITVNQAVDLAGRVFRGLSSASDQLFKSLDRAQVVEGVVRGFDTLQSQAGLLANDSLQKLRTATQGLVSDFDLMQQANQAVQLGLDPSKLDSMAEAATKLGAAVGRTAQEAFGDLITGVGRSSPLILDNLGITLKASESQEIYAAQIGKTVDALNEQEKAAAFQQAALQKIAEKSEQLAEIQETAATAATRLKTASENAFDEFVTGLSNSDELRDSLNELSEVIDDIDFKRVADGIGTIAGAIINISSVIPGAIEGIKELYDQFTALRLASAENAKSLSLFNLTTKPPRDFLKEVKEARQEAEKTEAFYAWQKAVKAAQSAIFELGKDQKVTTERLITARKALAGLSGAYDKTGNATKDHSKTMVEARKIVESLILKNQDYRKELEEEEQQQKRNEEAIQKANEAREDLFDKIGELVTASDAYKKVLEDLNVGTINQTEAQEKIAEIYRDTIDVQSQVQNLERQRIAVLEALRGVTDQNSESAQRYRQSLAELDLQIESLNTKPAAANGGALGGIFDDILGGVGSEFGFNLPGGLGELLEGQFPELSASVAGAPGFILTAVTQTAQQAIKALEDVFSGDSTASALGGTKLGLGALTGGLGFFLPDSFTEEIVNAFGFGGSRDAQNQARQGVDRFLADVFSRDRLRLVIQGELTDVFDFDFGGDDAFNNAGWNAALDALETDSKQAFLGVGTALNEIFETGQDLGGQLAAVFLNNVENANNLQIAVQTLGVSFEQMKSATVEAFLAGKISALEAQTALTGIEKLAAKGIPDAFGATTQAFENLIDSAGEGRVAIDAIVDLGAEAIEKGLTSLDELKAELVNSGQFSASEVEKLFAAIAGVGITELEQLKEIGTETAISILAQLEAGDFAFADTAEKVKQLADSVAELERDIESNITLNVRTNFDGNTEELVRAGADLSGLDVGRGVQ